MVGRLGFAPFTGAPFFTLILGENLGFANVGDNFLHLLFVIRALGCKFACTNVGELVFNHFLVTGDIVDGLEGASVKWGCVNIFADVYSVTIRVRVNV